MGCTERAMGSLYCLGTLSMTAYYLRGHEFREDVSVTDIYQGLAPCGFLELCRCLLNEEMEGWMDRWINGWVDRLDRWEH